ncbi:MAG: hypothetical protein GF331_26025 [Chitinivibrionales bacterium]|nr:hypothetical protein [Chitinivibrionales bacterium]
MHRVRAACMLTALLALCRDGMAEGQDSSLVTLHGYVSATLFYQDRRFLPDNGQTALWSANEPDTSFYGGDFRNTQIVLTLRGPVILGWQTGGALAMDLFGGFRASSVFSFLSPRPRVLRAYVQLSRGGATIRVGQDNPPLFPRHIPESISHITNPIGYGSAGVIGLYYPGLFFSYRRPIGSVTGIVEGAAMQNTWRNVPDSAVTTVFSHTSLYPQLQMRVVVTGDTTGSLQWSTFVAGHFDYKNLEDVAGFPGDDLTGWAGEVGARLHAGPFTAKGAGYIGHSIAQQFAQLLEFTDVTGWGAWGQVGVEFLRFWGVWVFAGLTQLDDDAEVKTLGNWTIVPMVRFSSGPLEIGVEWIHVRTEYRAGDRTPERPGNWLGVSTLLRY